MDAVKTHEFQAEVGQVLKLVINSLYSRREIFLRELVSNASDALDRLRFRAITEPELMGEDPTLQIRIFADPEQGLLRIEDTGVGMTEEEVVKNLGTVAHSGSRAFLEQIADSAKRGHNLIGQFGVGFYSAYLVADRVEVITRAAGAGAQAVKWSSDAHQTFTVEPAAREARGTEIVLHLRQDQRELLEPWRIRELVKRYSDYVSYPIYCARAGAGAARQHDKADDKADDREEAELEQINRASALWRRPKAEVTDEQYDELYRHICHDLERPLARTHFTIEGAQEFAALLYVPRHAPFDLQDGRKHRGVRLFVRRVFVMDDCDEILPSWLRFLRGVVDSEDLPLNVSRELLQDSAVVRTIKKQIIKRTLDLLEEMAAGKPDDYLQFWKNFGVVLKEGLAFASEYREYRERLAGLVRYESSRGSELTSLADYVARAPDKQEAIYYIFGPSRAAVAGSPYLEGLAARGYEVLYMTDPVDEWAATEIGQFAGKRLVSAMRADLPLDGKDQAEAASAAEAAVDLQPLRERIQKVLAERVREVKTSQRLTESPCCLVLADGATPAFMEQLLKRSGHGMPHVKRILEINPSHPLIQNLAQSLALRPQSGSLDEWIELLYHQALISEGSPIDDPNRLARGIASLLTQVTQITAVASEASSLTAGTQDAPAAQLPA